MKIVQQVEYVGLREEFQGRQKKVQNVHNVNATMGHCILLNDIHLKFYYTFTTTGSTLVSWF